MEKEKYIASFISFIKLATIKVMREVVLVSKR
jgi:hypothetical protein